MIMIQISKENKVILIDWGLFMHTAIFSTVKMTEMRPTYLVIRMIIASLMRVGVDKDDLVIIAVDGRGNWRKDFDSAYKANRPAAREKSGIDFPYWYKEFDKLLSKLNASTNFCSVKIPKMEADDIISYGVRYFKDNECVIISTDSDFEQLCTFDNVKILSPKTKRYKLIKNPHKILSKKIKREVADNLLTPITSEADYERRKTIVSLLKLPDFVEKQIEEEFENGLKYDINSEYDENLFPFPSLIETFGKIYNSDKITTIEKCMAYEERRKKRNKKKKEVKK